MARRRRAEQARLWRELGLSHRAIAELMDTGIPQVRRLLYYPDGVPTRGRRKPGAVPGASGEAAVPVNAGEPAARTPAAAPIRPAQPAQGPCNSGGRHPSEGARG